MPFFVKGRQSKIIFEGLVTDDGGAREFKYTSFRKVVTSDQHEARSCAFPFISSWLRWDFSQLSFPDYEHCSWSYCFSSCTWVLPFIQPNPEKGLLIRRVLLSMHIFPMLYLLSDMSRMPILTIFIMSVVRLSCNSDVRLSFHCNKSYYNNTNDSFQSKR